VCGVSGELQRCCESPVVNSKSRALVSLSMVSSDKSAVVLKLRLSLFNINLVSTLLRAIDIAQN